MRPKVPVLKIDVTGIFQFGSARCGVRVGVRVRSRVRVNTDLDKVRNFHHAMLLWC